MPNHFHKWSTSENIAMWMCVCAATATVKHRIISSLSQWSINGWGYFFYDLQAREEELKLCLFLKRFSMPPRYIFGWPRIMWPQTMPNCPSTVATNAIYCQWSVLCIYCNCHLAHRAKSACKHTHTQANPNGFWTRADRVPGQSASQPKWQRSQSLFILILYDCL